MVCQERMKREQVNFPIIVLNLKVIPLKLFLDVVPSSPVNKVASCVNSLVYVSELSRNGYARPSEGFPWELCLCRRLPCILSGVSLLLDTFSHVSVGFEEDV